MARGGERMSWKKAVYLYSSRSAGLNMGKRSRKLVKGEPIVLRNFDTCTGPTKLSLDLQTTSSQSSLGTAERVYCISGSRVAALKKTIPKSQHGLGKITKLRLVSPFSISRPPRIPRRTSRVCQSTHGTQGKNRARDRTCGMFH